jgi:hypothetical protein
VSEVFALNGAVIRDDNGANPAVVRLLEDALSRAKNGEYEMVCVVYIDRAGQVDNEWSAGKGRLAMIAGLEFAKRDIMDQ